MEVARTLSHPAAPRAPRLEPEHVVFVLTPNERELFFGGEPPLGMAWVRESWIEAERAPADEWEETLRALRPTVLVTAWSCPVLPEAWGQEEDCPLKYVCSVTGSVKPRVPRSLIERGLLVTNWGSLVSEAVAEHAVLMVLALLRSLPKWKGLVARSRTMFEMMPLLRSRTLRGKRVGLHGFGAVAREIVAILRPYDVEVSACSVGVPKAFMEEFGVRQSPSLEDLFASSDVLIECEALNEHSMGSVTEGILCLLPEDAVFVNVGRGAVVDEFALARMAGEGRLRVGLDVFRREPLSQASPLHDIPGMLLSPHIAGPTWETYPLCGAQALENLERYLRDEPVENRVTLEIYDRAT